MVQSEPRDGLSPSQNPTLHPQLWGGEGESRQGEPQEEGHGGQHARGEVCHQAEEGGVVPVIMIIGQEMFCYCRMVG